MCATCAHRLGKRLGYAQVNMSGLIIERILI